MAQIKTLDVKEINAAFDEVDQLLNRLRGKVDNWTLPKTRPTNPAPGYAYWPGDGTIRVWHPNGWEVYSKD